MKAVMGILSALVLALVAGCAGVSSSGMPCEKCKFGVPDKKANPPKITCVVDGKPVDCSKDPAACPECAKAAKQ